MPPKLELQPESFTKTTIARRMLHWATITHERRGISVISGPPGIGKTKALTHFQEASPEEVVLVKAARNWTNSGVTAIRYMAEAIRNSVSESDRYYVPNNIYELRTAIYRDLCDRDGRNMVRAKKGEYSQEHFRSLTVIFDEAQWLSVAAIDQLRLWNDCEGCYSPVPFGILLVGNDEFLLASNKNGESVISNAMSDRALYVESLGYNDVTDDDIRLYLESRGLVDEEAILKTFDWLNSKGVERSFRQMKKLFDRTVDDAAEGESLYQSYCRQIGFG